MNNTLVLTTTVLSAAVAATLIALIFVFALCLAAGAVVLYRAGRRECLYRREEAHRLIDENVALTKSEARALWQRDSTVKALDDAVSDLAEKDVQLRQWRLWAAFTDEVVQEAVNLADLCESQPAPAKSRNLLTAEKLVALNRLRGAVEAYHVHAADPESSLEKSFQEKSLEPASFDPEEFEAQLDDWAARNAPKPSHAKIYASPETVANPESGTNGPPPRILLGGRPAPVGRLDTITNRLVNTVREGD